MSGALGDQCPCRTSGYASFGWRIQEEVKQQEAKHEAKKGNTRVDDLMLPMSMLVVQSYCMYVLYVLERARSYRHGGDGNEALVLLRAERQSRQGGSPGSQDGFSPGSQGGFSQGGFIQCSTGRSSQGLAGSTRETCRWL